MTTLAGLEARMNALEERVGDHYRYAQERFQTGESQFSVLSQQQGQILTALQTLTAAVNTQVEDTSGVVSAYNNVQGAIKTGLAVQGICLFLLKWGVIGAGIVHAIQWVLKHFGPVDL